MMIIGLFKRRWACAALVVLAIVLIPYLYSRAMSVARQVSVHGTGLETQPARSSIQGIRVACYNIAHGRGLADSNHAGGSRVERSERLDKIASLLRDVDADVVVLNEVDFDASWSGRTNQAKYLAEKAGYAYWVEQRNLDFRILFWTWRFGNAVLSKQPIRDVRLVSLPPHASWESWMVGHKNGVTCTIDWLDEPLQVIAVHLEHRNENSRTAAMTRLLDEIRLQASPTILMGDLNSSPLGFPNSVSDPQGRNAMDLLDQSQIFRRHPVQLPEVEELTFRSDQPDRVIDWILIPRSWQFLDYTVHPSQLSDHRLIFADVLMQPND